MFISTFLLSFNSFYSIDYIPQMYVLKIFSSLLYKMECFIDFSAANKSDNLTCAIIYMTCDNYTLTYCGLILFLQGNGAIFFV